MKKTIYYTAVLAIAAGCIFSSCQSKTDRENAANKNVQDAKEELKEEQKELNAEYPAFKTDAESKIASNDKRIGELRTQINKPGKTFDELRKKRIDELEEKNAQLRSRLNGYETERSDWESFKREFNSDMEGMGEAFKNLGNNNVK